MVGIFTGAGAGLERGSAALLGSWGLLGGASFGRAGQQVLLNAATGNLVIAQQDEMLIGRGPDAGIARTYNSLGDLSDENGDNWRQSTDRRIQNLTGTLNTAGSTVDRVSADGSVITYAWTAGANAYLARSGSGAVDRLTSSGGVWTWVDGDTQQTETYARAISGQWLITAATDTSGNALTFAYTSDNKLSKVTTADGGSVEYSWSGNNITQVLTRYTDLASNAAKTLTRTRYGYDSSNRLTTVTVDLTPEDNSVADGQVYTVTYGYLGSTKLVSSIQESDGARVDIEYDASNRVTYFRQTATTGVQRTTRLVYGNNYSEVWDASGQVTKLTYDTSQRLIRIAAPPATAGAAAQTVNFTYGGYDLIQKVTDAAGGVTLFGYDANRNLISTTDPIGNVVTRTFSAKNELLTETRTGADASNAAAQHTTRYIYNAQGQVRWTISAEGRVHQYAYNSAGQLVGVYEYPATYSLTGLSATQVPTEQQVVNWIGANNDLAAIQVEFRAYDARGNLQVVHRTGNTGDGDGFEHTRFTYDQAGNLLNRVVDGHVAETFVYDGMGRLTASTDRNGGTTTVAFQNGGLQTIVTMASGLVQTSTYNLAGELIAFTESGSLTTGGTVERQYDALGRVRVVKDQFNNKSYALYDAAGRKTADVGPGGELTEYRYDAANRLVATARYATPISAANLQALANPNNSLTVAGIRPAVASGDVWTWQIFDAAGQLLERIDGTGAVVLFGYDASGRLISTTSPSNRLGASTIETYKTTPPTALVAPTADAAHDRVSRTFYDKDGLVLATLDGEGGLVTYSYNGIGQKVAEQAYATPTNASLRASGTLDALRSGLASSADRVTRFVYDPQGFLVFQIDPLGRVTEFARVGGALYDATGPVRKTVTYAGTIGALSAYTLTNVRSAIAAANLTNDPRNRSSFAVYDAADRLRYDIDAAGAVTGYSYDVAGRVTKITRYANLLSTTSLPALSDMDQWAAGNLTGDARVTRRFYTERGDLRFEVDGEGFVTANEFDAAGRITRTSRYDNQISVTDGDTTIAVAGKLNGAAVDNAYAYDALGRTSDVYSGLGDRTSYVYNVNGTLQKLITAAGTTDEVVTAYSYDGAGRILSQTDAFGTANARTVSYAYDAFGNRVSTTDARGSVTTVEFDRAGQMVKQTDAEQGVTTFAYNAFGERVLTTDARGGQTYSYFNAVGRLTAQIDAEGYLTESSYNVFGDLETVTRRYNRVGGYSVALLPSVVMSAKDATTRFDYDRLGRVWKTTDAMGGTESKTYNAFGQVASETSKLGATTTYAYERRGLLLRDTTIIGGLATATIENSYGYDARGNRNLTIAGSNGSDARVTRTYYDYNNRVYRKTLPAASYIKPGQLFASDAPQTVDEFYTFDRRGNLIMSQDGAGQRTFYAYDRLDRRTMQIDPSGIVQTWAYDANGNTLSTRTYDGYVSAPADDSVEMMVRRVYDVALGRQPEAYEINIWANYANSAPTGQSKSEYVWAYISTNSGVADFTKINADLDTFIQNTYLVAFRRNPNASEMNTWRSNLNGGMPRWKMLEVLSEHSGHVTINRQINLVANAAGLGGYRETTYSYDRLNRLKTTTITGVQTGAWTGSGYTLSTDPITTSVDYDATGNAIRSVDANGRSSFFYYDRLGRQTGKVDAEGYLTTWIRDAEGNVLVEGRYGRRVNASTASDPFDLSRMPDTADPGDRITVFSYDKNGNRLSERRLSTTNLNSQMGPDLPAFTPEGDDLVTTIGQVVRMYDLCLGRAPSLSEIVIWAGVLVANRDYVSPENINQFASHVGYTQDTLDRAPLNALEAMGGSILNDPGVGQIFDMGNLDNAAFMRKVYLRAFRREATQSEVDIWTNNLNSGGWTRGGILAYFSEYPIHRKMVSVTVTKDGDDTNTAVGQVIRMYDMVLSRPPNAGEIGGWTNYLFANRDTPSAENINRYDVDLDNNSPTADRSPLNALAAMGNAILQDPGVARIFDMGNPDNAAFVRKVYQHAFKREPEQYEVDAWVTNMNSGGWTRGGVLAFFSEYSIHRSFVGGYSSLIVYEYNAAGQVTSKTEATGEKTTYAYDNGGRLVYEERPEFIDYRGQKVKPKTAYKYDVFGEVIEQNNDGHVTSYVYDGAGRVRESYDALGHRKEYFYDRAGRNVGFAYDRGGNVPGGVRYAYDASGRLTAQGYGEYTPYGWRVTGEETRFEYNSFSEVVFKAMGLASNWDGTSVATDRYAYDGAGRLWRETIGGVWHYYAYDKAGNQTAHITSGGIAAPEILEKSSFSDALAKNGRSDINTTFTVYDGRGFAVEVRQEVRTFLTSGSSQATVGEIVSGRDYNAFGEVSAERDAYGNQTAYQYNAMGRLIKVTRPTVTIVRENGSADRVNPTERYFYDVSGRLIGTEDANGNRTSRTLLSGTGYGGTEALVTVEFRPDAGLATAAYDIFGNRVSSRDATNRTSYMEYDALGRMTKLTHAGNVLTETFTYDNQGNRTSRHLVGSTNGTSVDLTETTAYDIQGRVVRQQALAGTVVGLDGKANYQQGDITTTSYVWGGRNLVTANTEARGGWYIDTTVEHRDVDGFQAVVKATRQTVDQFGRVLDRKDAGGHTFRYTYGSDGLVREEVSAVKIIDDSGVERDVNSYRYTDWTNAGQIAAITMRTYIGDPLFYNREPNKYGTALRTEYSYDAMGRKTHETVVRDGSTLIQNGSASYDALGRMTHWQENGALTAAPAIIDYAYDAVGNIRSTTTTWRPLDDYGNPNPADPAPPKKEQVWYRFDSMNRVVVARGELVDGRIVRGAQGTDYIYDWEGRRVSATTDAMLRGLTYRTVTYNNGQHQVEMPDDGDQSHQEASWVNYKGERRENYDYDAGGSLIAIRVDESGFESDYNGSGSATFVQATSMGSTFTLDALGRVVRQQDKTRSGQIGYSRDVKYDGAGRIAVETVSTLGQDGVDVTSVNENSYGTVVSSTYALGQISSTKSTVRRGGNVQSTSITTNSYTWFDDPMLSSTSISETGQPYRNSDYVYDGFGGLQSVHIQDGRTRDVRFLIDANRQVLRRDETDAAPTGDPHELFYRFDGHQQLYVGNNGTQKTGFADSLDQRMLPTSTGPFRGYTYGAPSMQPGQSIDPINSYDQGSDWGSYQVRAGDTLASIAQQLWGDSSLWYELARANGLSSAGAVSAGQTLTIPRGVMRNTLNADSFRPYDPSDALGNNNPINPVPQARAQKKNGCGVLGQILLVVVAVAVAVVATAGAAAAFSQATFGQALGAMTGLGSTAAAGTAAGAAATATATATATAASIGAGTWIAAGAIGGALGSIASQGVGIATGLQDKFSWSGVALSALGGAVSGGLTTVNVFGKGAEGLAGIGNVAARGALSSVISQGIAAAAGLQPSFNWVGVAAAGISAAASGSIRLGGAGGAVVRNTAGGLANAASRSVLEGSDFGDNLLAGLPDVIGNTIGNLVAGAIYDPTSPQATVREMREEQARAAGLVPGSPEFKAFLKEHQATDRQYARDIAALRRDSNAARSEAQITSTQGRLASLMESVGREYKGLTDDDISDYHYATGGEAGAEFDPLTGETTTVITNGNPHHGVAVQVLADPILTKAGNLVRYGAERLGALMDEHPVLRTTVTLLDIGLKIAGGPARYAIGEVVGRLQEGATELLAGRFSSVGYDTDTALSGGIGGPVTLSAATTGFAGALKLAGLFGGIRIGAAESVGDLVQVGKNRVTFQGMEVRAVRDLSHVSDSTLQAMAKRGFAGKTADGESIVLHHHLQNPDGFIVELPASKHSIGNVNQHPYGNAKGAGLTTEQRTAFDNWRVDYWKARAQAELQKRAGQ